ncbi:MAG: biliverdin-producing heme oxygenase [Candidatus Microthrix sp.]|nr:biliverdin-producing heme oxygenase [Candidatus Microthrix sp.]
MTESTATIPESLSAHVREATATEHTEAENSAFIVALIGGDVPLAGYVGYLQQLRAVYELLERIVNDDRHGDVMGTFHDPGLERLQALETDLDWLELELDASGAQAPSTVLPATRAYLGDIEAAANDPNYSAPRLLAHHYIRYLGDLSGGFFVGKRIREIYGLTPDGGASVFDFPDIVGPGAWKQRYRDNLDALEWSAEERQAFVDEAKGAYLHHSKVFDELAEL